MNNINYYDTLLTDPTEKRGIDSSFHVWEYPDYSRKYIVVADVARGDSNDYSAFHIIDIEECKQIGEFKSQIGTKEFGHMLVAVATEFNNSGANTVLPEVVKSQSHSCDAILGPNSSSCWVLQA